MLDDFQIIGLTGGIATGKSTVSALLRERGVPVVDADVVAREVVEVGSPGLEAIRRRFGSEVLRPDGSLDREALGRVVFSDTDARRDLDAITHPRIGQRMMQHGERYAADGFGWMVYDAALIVENGLQAAFAGLIVVSCAPDTQLDRLLARDDLTRSEAEDRIAAQMPLAQKESAADWVIRNDGTLDDLRRNVDALYQTLVEEFGPPRTEPT